MIVLKNGKKAFQEEIEMIINRLDEVEECMVFGMPDKKDKSNIKLSVKVVYNKEVVKEKYPDVDEKELEKIIWEKIKEINKTLPTYKYIKHMILTDKELIKTTLNMSLDNPGRIIDNYLFKNLYGLDDIEIRINKYSNVTKEEIINFAKKVKLNTILCVRDGENEKN